MNETEIAMQIVDDLMVSLMGGRSWLEQMYFENLQDEMAPDLVLAHLELMREAGETVTPSLLALELMIKRNNALLR